MSPRRALTIALLLAGIVHIVAILAIPGTASRSAYGRVASVTDLFAVTLLPPDGSPLPRLDPSFVHAVCRAEFGQGAAILSGDLPPVPWMVSVVDETGALGDSFSSAGAALPGVDFIAGSAAAIDRIRSAVPVPPAHRFHAPVGTDHGFILLRVFAGTGIERPEIEAAVRRLRCARYDEAG
ncbi:hypothetical protein [Methylobrevis pamukkalensis]|uniref:DUF1254 domain-containing protein n=1 Tax=Methylobrevis pamukkalensis TaxID=1439726 RepID=A0A1E3H9F1_9HYPH|nr:hypothetical protein [Methylobrevis pamukkalensis]ODN72416.1 hypothetical protein A6302_00162 [Methylobrevis pamukkalensis]